MKLFEQMPFLFLFSEEILDHVSSVLADAVKSACSLCHARKGARRSAPATSKCLHQCVLELYNCTFRYKVGQPNLPVLYRAAAATVVANAYHSARAASHPVYVASFVHAVEGLVPASFTVLLNDYFSSLFLFCSSLFNLQT